MASGRSEPAPVAKYQQQNVPDTIAELQNQLAKEQRVAHGAQNLLHIFAHDAGQHSPHADQGLEVNDELRQQVSGELAAANARIEALQRQLEHAQSGGYGLQATEQDHASASLPLARIGSNASTSSNADFSSLDLSRQYDSAEIPIEGVLDDISRLTSLSGPAQIKCMNTVGEALAQNPQIAYRVPVEDIIQFIMPLLSDDMTKDTRSSAHWLIRLLCQTPDDVQLLQANNLDWLLIKSLSRDHKHDLEKQQALLTVRHFLQLTHTSSVSLVSVGLLRAIVALAENGEDRLRFIALQTLMELVVRDIELLAAADGIRVLLQALNDGPYELAQSIATTFLFLVDRPHLREYLHPGVDLEIAFSGLTEGTGKQNHSDERILSSGRLVVLLLKSWSGLFYFTQGKRQALRSLVGTLSAPSHVVVETMLDTLSKLFSFETPEWFSSFVAGKRLTLFRRKVADGDKDTSQTRQLSNPKNNGRGSMLDQHAAILLILLMEAGLGESLVSLTERNLSPRINRKTAVFIGEILRLSNRILPQNRSARFQALPRLFTLATDFGDTKQRFMASSTLFSVHSIHWNQDRLSADPTTGGKRQLTALNDDRTRVQVDTSKIRLGMQIDDATFRNLLLESQVLTAKEYNKWNFDVLTELVEGPLLNPKRIEEAAKGSKFLRRLTAFFHPLDHRYCDLKPSTVNNKFTRFACSLITTLLGTADGVRFLLEDRLFQQIADCLSLLESSQAPIPSLDNVFTQTRVQHTLTSGYFDMIAVCTKYEEGLKLLEHFKIFTALYHISDLKARDDITLAFIRLADYSLEGHPRVLLSKAMTCNNNALRFNATNQVASLIKSGTATNAAPQEWLIRLLVNQLYDVAANVRDLTVKTLEDICQSQSILEVVVRVRPTLDHLGYNGAPLLFRFLSTSVGVQYLHDIQYIDRGLDEWFSERNEFYVLQVELHLARLFEVEDDRVTDSNDTEIQITAPLHFYGELVKTEEGRRILQQKGHFSEFCDFLRENGLEDQNLEIISRLKSVLWAIGNIGSTTGGLPFLEEEDIIPAIIEVAERSQCFSVRGTCIYVLGLIASTIQGAEVLEEFGWESRLNSLGEASGICVPTDTQESLKIDTWAYKPPAMLRPAIPVSPESASEQKVIAGLLDLGNHIIATAASRVLARLKATEPQIFQDPAMLFRALFLIDNYHYRLPVRKYIFDLFSTLPFNPTTLASIRRAGIALTENSESALETDGEEEDDLGLNLKGALKSRSVPQHSILKGGTLAERDELKKKKEDPSVVVLQPNIRVKGFLITVDGNVPRASRSHELPAKTL